MKYTFCFNELLKNIHKREKFLLCKIFSSLDYPCILDYKEVFLTILSTSYLA